MSGGYAYGEQEPKEQCPYCRARCFADFVDIGIGYQQCGPYHCQRCGASEIGAFDDKRPRTAREIDTGWYEPNSPAGSSANVDADGNFISWHEADTLYRAGHGVAPRYDKLGRLIPDHEPKTVLLERDPLRFAFFFPETPMVLPENVEGTLDMPWSGVRKEDI